MATTTLTSPSTSVALELLTIPPPPPSRTTVRPTPHEDLIQPSTPAEAPTAPTTPADTRRLFDAAPTVTADRKSRFIITGLLVCVNIIQFVSNFSTIGGGLYLSEQLGRPTGTGQANWMAASYSLTQGSFVLISGRLGTIHGHQRLALLGSLVFTISSLANAFCRTYDSFVALRALTGIGGGLFMPNAVALITTMMPPGNGRNLCLGFFAAAPPLGGVLGGVLVGVFVEFSEWMWFYVMIAACSLAITIPLAVLFPKEQPVDKNGKIDYVGAVLGLGALLLFNVVWNQAPAVGWHQPYEIACLVISVLLFAAFLVYEQRLTSREPIMPVHIFRAPTFSSLILVVLLTYMAFGISLWYSISWQQVVRGASVLQTGINFIPFGIGAVASVALAAWMLPRVGAQWIMALGIGTTLAANVLLATMPPRQTYWAQVFPATLVSSFSPDLVYVAAQLIASNSVGRRHQGVAGSLIGTLNLYGNSLGLGFAGTVEGQISKGEEGEGGILRGYRAALYFGVALAAVGLVLDFAFVRMPKDERSGWDESLEEDTGYGAEVGGASATGVERA